MFGESDWKSDKKISIFDKRNNRNEFGGGGETKVAKETNQFTQKQCGVEQEEVMSERVNRNLVPKGNVNEKWAKPERTVGDRRRTGASS